MLLWLTFRVYIISLPPIMTEVCSALEDCNNLYCKFIIFMLSCMIGFIIKAFDMEYICSEISLSLLYQNFS